MLGLNWAIFQYLFKIISNRNKLLGKCPFNSLNYAFSRFPLYGFMFTNIHAVVCNLICLSVCFGFVLLKYLPLFFFLLLPLELWLFLLFLVEYSRRIIIKNILVNTIYRFFFLRINTLFFHCSGKFCERYTYWIQCPAPASQFYSKVEKQFSIPAFPVVNFLLPNEKYSLRV